MNKATQRSKKILISDMINIEDKLENLRKGKKF
jgi:hypothetical protein